VENISFADLFIWYVGFLFSVTAHEAAHALVAMKGGDLTAYLGGQVSLNPIPHIKRSPVGTVVIPLLSFILGGWMIGWASAPYDRVWAERYPRRAAWMAAAGPAANFLIAVAAFIFIKVGLAAGIFTAPVQVGLSKIVTAEAGIWMSLAKLVSVLLMLNLILLIFNLFPFPPLDGSNVITLLMPHELALRFRHLISQPAYSFLGIVLAWKIFGYVFRDVFIVILKLVHPESSYY
jgi:Zn-dependent protease